MANDGKRARSPSDGNMDFSTLQPEELATFIREGLESLNTNDPIHECGNSVLSILRSRPEEVVRLGRAKLHAWPFRDVPTCWRRAIEEGSLWTIVRLLESQTIDGKRRRADPDLERHVQRVSADLLDGIVETLDRTIILTGAPRRKVLIDDIIELLQSWSDTDTISDLPSTFPSVNKDFSSQETIPRTTRLTLEQFQHHLDTTPTPLIISNVLDEWPARCSASHQWSDPKYLMRLTLSGRRLVPVELGRSYTDDGWGQRIMTFGNYMRLHLLSTTAAEVGYLAQHDLLTQIPELSASTITPDYCYTCPPEPDGQSGVTPQPPLDEPLRNAWLGPPGTISPLHTDPYHNILAQVVGRKYIRLYPPSETSKLYPRGIDETGISMENTSSVDVAMGRKFENEQSAKGKPDAELASQRVTFEEQFPLFKDADYFEGILEAGECLYIPVGWWHFIESLEVSFNVSYWFN